MPQLEFSHQFNYRPLLVETGGRKELTIPLPVIEATFLHNGLMTSDFAIIDSRSTFSLQFAWTPRLLKPNSCRFAEQIRTDLFEFRISWFDKNIRRNCQFKPF
jgi:hypothetical protein